MIKKMIIVFLLVVVIIVFFISLRQIKNKAALEPLQHVEELNMPQLELSISKGIDFLYQNQLPYGEFRTYASSDKRMKKNCYFDSSPAITTVVLHSISFVDHPKVEEMTQKALSFFLEEMEGNGIWRYWTSRSKKNKEIDPDLDDISCVSYALKKHRIPFKSNLEIILANRNEQGLFYTWIRDSGQENDIDCVVNANVLRYLGENEDTEKVCKYLNDIVLHEKEGSCSLYYPDKLTFYYAISRAYFNGISCLSNSVELIINRIISIKKKEGSFGNELLTAFAVCTLLNLNHHNPQMDKAIEYILNTQREDGSWPRFASWLDPASYYGSEELTTALCIEALARYQRLMNAGE